MKRINNRPRWTRKLKSLQKNSPNKEKWKHMLGTLWKDMQPHRLGLLSLLLVVLLILSGCASLMKPPIVAKRIPSPPAELLMPPEALQKLSGVDSAHALGVIVGNYQIANRCALKLSGWQEWWLIVKPKEQE